MNREALDQELIAAEGNKLYLYDDADGSRLRKGALIKGTPTIGAGINVLFLYPEESTWLLHNRQNRAIAGLQRQIPWFDGLDDVRQRAFVNLYFNVPEFIYWTNFMNYAGARDWEKAAAELENTHPWIDEVGSRGHKIAQMLRIGTVLP